MRLFIKVENGEPIEHPIFEDNFALAFPDIDISADNVPPGYALFIRVEKPNIDRFEVYEGVTYEWNGWAFADKHHVRPMTAAERDEEIEKVKALRPNEKWRWDDVQLVWKPPLRPKTGGPWKLDLTVMDWVPDNG